MPKGPRGENRRADAIGRVAATWMDCRCRCLVQARMHLQQERRVRAFVADIRRLLPRPACGALPWLRCPDRAFGLGCRASSSAAGRSWAVQIGIPSGGFVPSKDPADRACSSAALNRDILARA
jgi:hypothetical protein